MYKLREIGTPDYLQKLIQSFLTDRYFQVKVNDTISPLHPILAGVPQGSVLSPTLFSIFTADYPTPQEASIALYADDTAIFTSHTDINLAYDYIQSYLHSYTNWTKKWRIKINPLKSQSKIFTLRRPPFPAPLRINNTDIPWLSHSSPVKYLGVLLDKRLTWKPHIISTAQKTRAKMFKLYPFINKNSTLSIETGLLIYKTIIRPTMTYACPIWRNIAPTNLSILQKIQNKYLRQTLNAPWFISNSQIHRELQVPLLSEFISQTSQKYYSLLHACPNAPIFNLGQNSHYPSRIRSRFPKDLFRPP